MSGSDPVIRRARADDLGATMVALVALSVDLGDPFHATADGVADALFGPAAFARAHLALAGAVPCGVVLTSPQFSTTLGGAVTHVSDLWVSQAARGQGLGRRLLAVAARDGEASWHARALRLTVYAENAAAQDFYCALGFGLRPGAPSAILDGASFRALSMETA